MRARRTRHADQKTSRSVIKNVSGSARMNRLSCYMMRMLPVISLAFAAIAHGENPSEGRGQERFELVETTIADIQRAYRSELLTPEQLVKMYQADRKSTRLNSSHRCISYAV